MLDGERRPLVLLLLLLLALLLVVAVLTVVVAAAVLSSEGSIVGGAGARDDVSAAEMPSRADLNERRGKAHDLRARCQLSGYAPRHSERRHHQQLLGDKMPSGDPRQQPEAPFASGLFILINFLQHIVQLSTR
jgi:hypothetical protein